jgi:hypothetical protein
MACIARAPYRAVPPCRLREEPAAPDGAGWVLTTPFGSAGGSSQVRGGSFWERNRREE